MNSTSVVNIPAYGSEDWFKYIRTLQVDPLIEGFDHLKDEMVNYVWREKYRFRDEADYFETVDRVVSAIYSNDTMDHHKTAEHMMRRCLFIPAGRILTGAGTGMKVTLMNCYVNQTIDDSMVGIMAGLNVAALTGQQGGGIGTDFSPIRPPDALVQGSASPASGPGPFIDSYYAVGNTVASAGSRRHAQMGTICDTHPYLPSFITAKQQPGVWEGFNVSVLVSDALMAAVAEDEEWLLYFHIPPVTERSPELIAKDFEDEDEVKQYVYSVWRARDLWDLIARSTYDYAEPGVIFIDRVNDMNNLKYCEEIRCTNPCGEQPLPPNGTCNLGAVNLARMVRNPFTEDAEFDYDLLKAAVQVGVRFLDNVIEHTNYPVKAQEEEEFAKRRIGLGITGLADAMAFLGIRYGSSRGATFAERVMESLAKTAYRTSIELAKERGPFPLFDPELYGKDAYLEKRMPQDIRDAIKEHGIRTGVSLTIAPTGSTSIAPAGNVGSGLEPIWEHVANRKIKQADRSFKDFKSYSFASQLWMSLNPGKTLEDLPSHMITTEDVKIHEHLRVQEVCQYWIDASISKTINVPEDIEFEDFRDVYLTAYESDCKGCTTYRPNDIRGSILSKVGTTRDGTSNSDQTPIARPEILDGKTVQIKWPGLQSSIYLCLNLCNGKPYEVFLMSKDQRYMEWTTTVTLLMSRLIRMGMSIKDLAAELRQVSSIEGGWGDGIFFPSLVSYIGHKLERLAEQDPTDGIIDMSIVPLDEPTESRRPSKKCERCGSYHLKSVEGCLTCNECGWSKCG